MAVVAAVVTVATTATSLTGTEGDAVVGTSVQINNTSAVIVYLGGSGVTTATGFPVAAGAVSQIYPLASGEALFGIVAASTAAVPVLRTGV